MVRRLSRESQVVTGGIDHEKVEQGRTAYRNLARDQQEDRTTKLMLTQGVALWHPVLRHFMQGEMTVDATEVPGKDADWLEQVLTPESMRELLKHFTAMTLAAFRGVDHVVEAARVLVKVFMGETADMIVFIARTGAQMSAIGSPNESTALQFNPREVVLWCINANQPVLVVDYVERKPPHGSPGRHVIPFPKQKTAPSNPLKFGVSIVKDEKGVARGGVFVYSQAPSLSELTESLLASIAGTVQLALAIEDRIAETQRAQSLAAKERERMATVALARQYRHAVLKKADLLEFHAGLLRETSETGNAAKVADALVSMSENLVRTGKSFETDLKEEIFDLGDLLSAASGSIIETYPDIEVLREPFGNRFVRGVRPFVEGAFENLLLNAVEAQSNRGRIGLRCRLVPTAGRGTTPSIEVSVCDDGPGLNPEIREHIEKGDHISTKGGERGLGLIIARSTITECGGQLSVLENPLEGWKGACFKVTLPLVQSPSKRK